MRRRQHKVFPIEIARRLEKELVDLGLVITYAARTTTSVYMKFEDKRLGTLTVRDHKGKPKYKYRWNIVIGYNGNSRVRDNGYVRDFFNETEIDRFMEAIRAYHCAIRRRDKGRRQYEEM